MITEIKNRKKKSRKSELEKKGEIQETNPKSSTNKPYNMLQLEEDIELDMGMQ